MTNEEAIKQQQFLIDAYKELQNIGDRAIKVGRIIKSCEMSIEALSEQRANGHWIDRESCQVDEDRYEVAICSNCGAEITLEYPYDNYCPNCGADMRGTEK